MEDGLRDDVLDAIDAYLDGGRHSLVGDEGKLRSALRFMLGRMPAAHRDWLIASRTRVVVVPRHSFAFAWRPRGTIDADTEIIFVKSSDLPSDILEQAAVLAHEVGHVRYHDAKPGRYAPSLEEEIEADRFADECGFGGALLKNLGRADTKLAQNLAEQIDERVRVLRERGAARE